MYCEQIGYAHSTPPDGKSQRCNGLPLENIVPPVKHLKYIIDLWVDIGPTCGESPISYAEIKAYPVDLSIFEAEVVRSMSKSYLSGYSKGSKKNTAWPWDWQETKAGQDALSEKIKRIFS